MKNLELIGIDVLITVINYFKEKDKTLKILEQSIKNSFTKDTTILMNGSSDNNREKQLLVNSLEDLDNPIRLIFAVDMLNEGWDVLNLFDIVRLYDTRQGSGKAGKVGTYTIKEAQLIGRGARYCPFVDKDEELKYKRKYDLDLLNKNRILETMYFHSKNDSKYISELKQALIETGLQAPAPITIEYKLKSEFKESEFYEKTYVFSNKRVPKGRGNIITIEPSMRNKIYHYTVPSGRGNIVSLFSDETNNSNSIKTKIKVIKFKEIDLNILLGTSEYFDSLQFNILKQKYPILKSKKEFFTSNQFIGNSTLEIKYTQNELKGRDLFLAVKSALNQISSYIISLKQEFYGTREFTPKLLKDVLKDKKIYMEKIDSNGGKGNSQIDCINEEYRLDLKKENWYVFNDNYGTSEEKLFLKYFKNSIEPKLKAKNLEYYVLRNERIPELAIYSFEAGERFEPDFLLFIRKNKSVTYQSYIEPKGNHLLDQDSWKEEFLLQMKEYAITEGLFSQNFKIIGLPFFNKKNRMQEFEVAIDTLIEKM